ncbi:MULTISPECIES: 2-succinyl-6-hydroxy-2,4-cyclohexadiene-1-carboxylate synthase [unclassified Bacillus (in: firmicutes)]|uniref:2-succinyl-6-hydroxy-2, 4-cyclohexadiene-1-carboxylate synthase n=1 Tax=unclassified Bacillus (in: firmicutes) TaxID=185979 RepID=UPI001BE625C1|nr:MULTISPECIES: 2-succinyl-6-hydroxy-2,4-cyclohexadiene-1-carboxylate synthase [unclassified Bacillus (in: firmicutes)]MBT2640382.1 2-succinyl-6-hydroxy-2,4-cyclohexadiene-1-carboxylate synthase [Bacillus sp. ISL-39]MBT2662284.1 2-succinyl-6-hydroxy-2,4-cyclohexadiene-1-carboxylate synthase [Bacillus sp. ISL-45]
MKTLINGVRYHVEQCGDGFPLVLLHGFTGAASTWKPFCPMWGKHSKLLMVDLIGHGETESPGDTERYDIQNAANDLKVLLDQLGIEKADFLGYSMGGRTAITFASLYPERVRKLVLESTTPGLVNLEERDARIQQDYKLAGKIEHEGLEPFITFWESIPLFQSQLNLTAEVREQIRSQRLRNDPVGLANSLRGMGTGAQPSWWDHLENFDFETLLITGELDEKFCKIAAEMASILPNPTHLTINSCGHAIHVEEREKFGTIVSEFLSNT